MTFHYGKPHPGDPDDTWKLWFDIFGDGESGPGDREVIIILDDDKVVIGKIISWNDSWIQIKGPCGGGFGRDHHVYWETIRFMAHEGFPVRKILCAPQPKTMRKIRSLGRAARIRKALKQEFDGTFNDTDIFQSMQDIVEAVLETAERYKAKAKHFIVRKKPRTEGFGGMSFGDPFCAEFVGVRLLNPGNHGPWWNDEPDEETLLLEAEDGSRALLWDLPSVLALEYDHAA